MIRFMNKSKKWNSIVMAVIMLLSLFLPNGLVRDAYASEPEVVAGWFFTSNTLPVAPTSGTEENKTSGLLTVSGGRNVNYTSSNSTLYTDKWDVPGGYWQAQISTTGYSQLTLSSKHYGSKTGPRDFKIQYSIDGTNFNDVIGGEYMLTESLAYGPNNLALPGEAENQEIVYIRWLNTSNVSINGGTVASGGTSRIADIKIMGVPITDGDEQESSKPVASKITFSDDYRTITGAEGSVVGDAEVKVYFPDQSLVGTVIADTYGSFILSIDNPDLNTSVLVSATERGKFESEKVTVSIQQTAEPDASKIAFTDANTVRGTAGAVANNASVKVYFDDGSLVGTTTAAANGSFNLTIENPNNKNVIYVAAKENGKLESGRVAVNLSVPGTTYQPGDVVFSQIYVNGGNSGAFYKTKFFELYNTTDHDIHFNNEWAIIYVSATGSSFGAGQKLTGTIKAHGYYLVAASTGSTGAALPVVPDQTMTNINPSNGNPGGILAIAHSTTGLTDQDDPNAIDILTYGNGTNTSFKTKTDHWGTPFYASNIGSGTILRKTNAGSDPRAAFGLGNGWFTKDPSQDFVMNTPNNTSSPDEIMIRNSKYMVAPAADKIAFTNVSGHVIVSGAAGSVPASALIKAYVEDAGVVSVAGQATAAADGSFTLDFTDSGNHQAVYVTHTDSQYHESMYTRVNAAGFSSTTTPIGELHKIDANGLPIHFGYSTTIEGVVTTANQALGNEKTHFYLQDATGGIQIIHGSDPIGVMEGHKARISGRVAFSAGMTQFVPSSIQDLGAPESEIASAQIGLDALSSYSSAEPLEGSLVTFTATVTNIPANGPDYNLTVTDEDGNAAIVRVLGQTGLIGSVQQGEQYTFTGIVGQSKVTSPYTSGYYLLPRKSSDIKGELQLNHTPLTKAYTGIDVSFAAVAKYADSVTLYYKNPGDAVFTPIEMISADGMNYNAKITADRITGDRFEYYIEAKSGVKTKSVGSATEPITVPVTEKTDGPAFSGESPANGDKIETTHPVISVKMYDPLGVDVSSVAIHVDQDDFTNQAAITEGKIKLTLQNDLSVGTHIVTVSAKDLRGNLSTYSWTFEILPRFAGGNHYLGTTHNHTNISHDAVGDPEQALIASKSHGYDWFAFSDHSHDIDPELLGKDSVERKDGLKERTGGVEWQLTKRLAREYTHDGEFVVFPAFEMTSTTWGHSNVFGTENFIDRKEEGGIYQDLQKYYAWILTYDDIVAQFNHPAMSKNAFDNFIPYNKQLDQLFTMIEVGNGSGKYSYVNAEKKFFSALDLGWHVAPTYGEDNHDATWGQTNKRTVIVAKDLSYDSLLDAMRKMRVYFTEDKDFTFDVLASDFYMGSITDTKQLNFKITGTSTNQNVTKVEILTNGGRVIDSKTMNTKNLNWEPAPINTVGNQQWFVVRVTLANGAKAYSSPIWTPEEDIAVKVSNVEAADGVIIANTPANLKTGITNLGIKNVTNMKVKFYYDIIDENHFIGESSIETLQPNKSETVYVTWANPVAGLHKILVKLEADQDLGDYVFEQEFTIQAPLGIKIMIDASHNNENTTKDTGTYKDNLKIFTTMMRQEAYTVVENHSTITPELLQDIQILMVTHPATEYSQTEIDAIRDFVHAGGSLLLTGKSNYKANQNPNSLLQGIGSSILINNDGVFDESDTGNFWSGNKVSYNYAVRPHPTPLDNYLTDFVNSLDYYSGASLAKNNGGVKDKLVDDDKVTILVRGNETTFQSNLFEGGVAYNVWESGKQPGNSVTGGTEIPLAAIETIGNGRIFVIGMNAFNDKQLDQSYEPKGNVPFAHNVVNWLAHRETSVTSIGDARHLPVDSSVVVQGTVTSAGGVFFDAFYLQDETGGIMAFNQVPDHLEVGDIVRIYGHISIYENNLEVEISEPGEGVIVVGAGTPIEPREISTHDANLDENQGQLVKVTGRVVDNSKAWEASPSYVINDGSGDLVIFIDGYIINQSGPIPKLKNGDLLEVVGYTAKAASGTQIRVGDTRMMKGTPIKSNDATLSRIEVDGRLLDRFSSETFTYNVELPSGTATAPKVTAIPTDEKATVKITQAAGLPGTATITVTAEDGLTEKTYTIYFTVRQASRNPDPDPDNEPIPNPHSRTGKENPPSDKNDAGIVIIGTDQLRKSQNNRIIIEVPSGKKEIRLPLETKDLIGKNTIVVKTDTLTLEIPPELLDQISNGLISGVLKESSISLKLEAIDRSEANRLIAKGENSLNAKIKLGGEVYQLNLSITTADGKSVHISKFDQPITIRLKVDSSLNPKLTAIFYISDEGTLEYVGGKYLDGYMIAQLHHFSKYAILQITKHFDDVTSGYWASHVIEELAAKQIINGTSVTTFEPQRAVTRAEFTNLLVKALNLATEGEIHFRDITASAWYAKPISIAYQAGLVKGKGAEIFDPNGQITREEMVTILIRAYKFMNGSQVDVYTPSPFNDMGSVSPWAADSVNAAATLDLIKGRASGQFVPKGILSRAEAAQVIYNLLNSMK